MPTIITSMKSKFAKFVDCTLGAALVFFAATAVLRYYTTLDIAAFSAVAVTACAVILMRFTGKRKESKIKLSHAADDMFYEFLFEDDIAPAKRLADGLKAKGVNAVRRGKGVYTDSRAAYCLFDDTPPTARTVARLVSKAKHYGKNTAIIFCRSAPPSPVDTGDFSVRYVCGDDVYKLFGALGALPAARERKKKKRFAAFSSALGTDKTVRYLLLAAAMFFIGITLKSIVTFVCACICAALCVATLAVAAVKKLKRKTSDK